MFGRVDRGKKISMILDIYFSHHDETLSLQFPGNSKQSKMKRKRIADAGKVIQFWNCSLLKKHELIKDDLWIRDGIILDPHVIFFDEHVAADVRIDCKGLIIAPGYIDVQINGKCIFAGFE